MERHKMEKLWWSGFSAWINTDLMENMFVYLFFLLLAVSYSKQKNCVWPSFSPNTKYFYLPNAKAELPQWNRDRAKNRNLHMQIDQFCTNGPKASGINLWKLNSEQETAKRWKNKQSFFFCSFLVSVPVISQSRFYGGICPEVNGKITAKFSGHMDNLFWA